MIPAPVEEWMTGLLTTDAVEEAMRQKGAKRDFPIIGPLVGQACATLCRAIGAKRVFEMGSGFGYSAWWFAHAVGDGGEVVHTDGDRELSDEARLWLSDAGVDDRVRFEVGDALALLEAEEGPFDVVFIDIDKGDYPRAWGLARQKVRVGGLILTDNTLWSGKVADKSADDGWTRAVRAYDKAAFSDPDFSSFIIPVRDGLCVSLRLA